MHLVINPPSAALPIYITGAYTQGTDTTVVPHQPGDLLIQVMINGSAAPTLDSGWTRLGEYGQSFARVTVDYVLSNGSPSIGPASNSTRIMVAYREASAITVVDNTVGTVHPITYPAASGTGVLARVAATMDLNATTGVPSLPTGTTARVSGAGGTATSRGMRWADSESSSLPAFTGSESGTFRWSSITLAIT